MVDTLPMKGNPLAPRETRLSDDLSSYIAELTRLAPGTISFRTGSGRLLRDLLIHWPTLQGWESQAQALCSRIVDAIYPLAGFTYAQAMEVNVTISRGALEPPKSVGALETYAVFDAQSGFEKLYYLNPKEKLPDPNAMRATGGVTVVGRPLNVFYHTLKDDRRKFAHIRKGMYELPQSMINALYEEPAFIPSDYEKKVRESLRKTVEELPVRVARFEQRREAVFAPRRARAPEAAAVAVPAVTALSALPPPVRAAEHRLMSYAMDRELSPEFRLQVRRAAQSLREAYPQAVMTEEARAQLSPRLAMAGISGLRPEPQITPVPRQTAEGPAPQQEPGQRAPVAGLAPVVSPIGTVYGPPPAAPGIQYTGPVSPALERRRISASEQINQPQLPVDRVEPDRAGAPRAGLQPEAQPATMPFFPPAPPPPIPRREPDLPELDITAPELSVPSERREGRNAEARARARAEVSPEPMFVPPREAGMAPEYRVRQPEGVIPRAQPELPLERPLRPEDAFVLAREARPEPLRETSFAARADLAARAALLPSFRNEDRPRNVYESLRPGPDAFPRMTPAESAGRLQRTMQAQLTQKPPSQPKPTQHPFVKPQIQPWMFPTPSPSPYPRTARLKGK